jgi:hypothetical protein
MRSILGRVPGAEKNSPKSNHSAPQQPHPDDAVRPVRPPQKLLKQRGGCSARGEGAWSGETFAIVKSLSTPTTPPGRRLRPVRPPRKLLKRRGGCSTRGEGAVCLTKLPSTPAQLARLPPPKQFRRPRITTEEQRKNRRPSTLQNAQSKMTSVVVVRTK